MTFWGELRAGGQMLLGQPVKASLSYDRDAPAHILEAVFPADQMWEELTEVVLYHNGKPAFKGIVDEQNSKWGAGGLTIELVCRSMEALLLDNEAKPGTTLRPSLEKLSGELLSPLGLYEVIGDKSLQTGAFAIEKGESCWTVLQRFCASFLGTTPYIDAEGTVHCENRENAKWNIGDIISAEVSFLPCKRLSAVWQQSCGGNYDTQFRDREAPLPRVRYVSMENKKDAREVLEKGRKESLSLTVECPGVWWPAGGAEASLTLPHGKSYEGCQVTSAVCTWDEKGQRTRLVLEGGKVICG